MTLKRLLTFLTLTVSAVGVLLAWQVFVFLNVPPGDSEQKTLFSVAPGDSLHLTARRLEEQSLISDALRFRLLARVMGETVVRVGDYELSQDMRPQEVLRTVVSGRSVETTITFQEGLNLYEMADLIAKKGLGRREDFLAVARDRSLVQELLGEQRSSLEGYLFPDTYRVNRFTRPETLVRRMFQSFSQAYEKARSEQKVKMTRHQLVTLASIIEKETGAPEERRVISSVYHNRLVKPMRLQADPTVLYGIWVATGSMKKNLTRKDLREKTKYNTYRISGLPYGPIANPGEASLRAAAFPEKTDYLYFVSRNDGTHVFSKNYDDHRQAVRKFQLDRSAREGKSWRDLSRRKQTEQAPKN